MNLNEILNSVEWTDEAEKEFKALSEFALMSRRQIEWEVRELEEILDTGRTFRLISDDAIFYYSFEEDKVKYYFI